MVNGCISLGFLGAVSLSFADTAASLWIKAKRQKQYSFCLSQLSGLSLLPALFHSDEINVIYFFKTGYAISPSSRTLCFCLEQ